MIPISAVLNHYKRQEIQQAIIEHAMDKEVAIKFGDNGFGKRPDILQYPNDVLELAKKGATSFHVSEEMWDNPLRLDPSLKRSEMDEMRKGWDLLLDIDCDIFDYSKIAADLIVDAIEEEGIKGISVKFSGNHGFHIGVCFESFPEIVNGKNITDLFPEAARKIAAYLSSRIENKLTRGILEKDSISEVAKKTGKSIEQVSTKGKFDPFTFLDVDTILIASR